MLNLILAVLCSAAFSLTIRLSAGKIKSEAAMQAVNYLTCLVIGGCMTGWNLLPDVPGVRGALVMGCAQGAFYLLALVLLQSSITHNGVVLSAIFQRLGLLVPMVVSIFLFGELPGAVQVAGFAVALFAMILMNLEPEQTNIGKKSILVILLLVAGFADVMAKLYEQWGTSSLSDQFLLYTFVAAFVIAVGIMLRKRERPGLGELVYGVVMGIPNYYCVRFLLASLSELPAVIVYPSFSVGAILVVSLAGVAFFGERLTRRQWTAVGIILIALVLLNV